ncbi:MAG: TlpA family protein disulfide reductase [Nitrospirae bacterium]|nr:TlpA family protein disulfide reductase [Nitrospirota bacterium]
MENLHQHFKGKPFALIAVDVQEDKETVLRYVRNQGVTYVNVLDMTGDTSSLYGVSSTPVKFLIGADGNMVGAGLGYKEWDRDEIKSLIQTLIDASRK